MALHLSLVPHKKSFKSKANKTSYFGTEERFRDTNKIQSDVMYEIPKIMDTQPISFPCASRFKSDESRINAAMNGPGSYDVSKSYDFNSEYVSKPGYRFPTHPRESMVMKTPSPGAVYQTEKVYWNGPEKQIPISFNCDSRFADIKTQMSNSQLYIPPREVGKAITIGKRLKYKDVGSDSPGPIYRVHEIIDFKTSPSFSFGKNKNKDRFKHVAYLPEPDD